MGRATGREPAPALHAQALLLFVLLLPLGGCDLLCELRRIGGLLPIALCSGGRVARRRVSVKQRRPHRSTRGRLRRPSVATRTPVRVGLGEAPLLGRWRADVGRRRWRPAAVPATATASPGCWTLLLLLLQLQLLLPGGARGLLRHGRRRSRLLAVGEVVGRRCGRRGVVGGVVPVVRMWLLLLRTVTPSSHAAQQSRFATGRGGETPRTKGAAVAAAAIVVGLLRMQLTARPAKLLLQRLLLLQLSLLLPQRCGGALCTGMGGELKRAAVCIPTGYCEKKMKGHQGGPPTSIIAPELAEL